MPVRPLRPLRAFGLALAACAVIGTALTGCTNQAPNQPDSAVVAAPTSTSTKPASTPTATPTPTDTGTAVPGATQDPSTPAALTKFTGVVQQVVAANPQADGRDVIDALVAAGFVKTDMQLTPDDTTIGRNVDSIEFSVVWKKTSCLVGQIGSQGVSTTSAPVLGTGTCLIGNTRAIDW